MGNNKYSKFASLEDMQPEEVNFDISCDCSCNCAHELDNIGSNEEGENDACDCECHQPCAEDHNISCNCSCDSSSDDCEKENKT